MFFGKSLFSRFQIRNQAGKGDSSQRTLLRQNSAGEPLEERRLLAVSGNSLLSRWFGRSAGGATKRGSVRPRSLWQEMFASSGSGARRRHSLAVCGGFAVEMLEDRRLLFNPVGTDWGVGATVSFGYMADGVMDSSNLDGGWTNTALTTMVTAGTMPATFDVEIERALLTWSRLANINFNEVADGGEDFGDPGPADIR